MQIPCNIEPIQISVSIKLFNQSPIPCIQTLETLDDLFKFFKYYTNLSWYSWNLRMEIVPEEAGEIVGGLCRYVVQVQAMPDYVDHWRSK